MLSSRIFLLAVSALIYAASLLYSTRLCHAQSVVVGQEELTLLAVFDEATSLDIDPAGLIYVVDQGAHNILQLDASGVLLQTFGGPGDGEGQFDSPADIDATNGLVLVIADAGNGRIQRFSREFLFLESLPLGDFQSESQIAQGNAPGYRQRIQELSGFGSGRPIAVVTSRDNDMYAIDETSALVAKWDQNRNIEQYIGAFDQGDGSLMDPVAMALNQQALYVLDRGHDAIMVYDAFGGFDRTMAEGRCQDARALHLSDELLFVVKDEVLLGYESTGMPVSEWTFEIEEFLVDVAMRGDRLYVLTEQKLYEMTLPF